MDFRVALATSVLSCSVACSGIASPPEGLPEMAVSRVQALHDRAQAMLEADEAEFLERMRTRPESFRDGDLYVSLIDGEARLLASSARGVGAAGGVGRDLGALRDCTGRLFVREFVELARVQRRGFYEYCWINPETGQAATKFTNFRSVGGRVLTVSGWK